MVIKRIIFLATINLLIASSTLHASPRNAQPELSRRELSRRAQESEYYLRRAHRTIASLDRNLTLKQNQVAELQNHIDSHEQSYRTALEENAFLVIRNRELEEQKLKIEADYALLYYLRQLELTATPNH